jgi:hypothetical protein
MSPSDGDGHFSSLMFAIDGESSGNTDRIEVSMGKSQYKGKNSPNAQILLVMTAAADTILVEGRRRGRLIIEFSRNSSQSQTSQSCVHVQDIMASKSIYTVLVEKQIEWIWVETTPAPPPPAAPDRNLARQGISSLCLG